MKTSLVFKGFSFWLTPAAPSNVQKRVPREFKQLLPARIGDTLMHRLRSPWLCPPSWAKRTSGLPCLDGCNRSNSLWSGAGLVIALNQASL